MSVVDMTLVQGIWRTSAGGRALCLAGAGLGLIGLIGWLTGVEALAAIVPAQPPMVPNTCLALFILGLAGALRYPAGASGSARYFSVFASVTVLALGLVTIGQWVLDLPFSIDQLLMRGAAGPSPPVAIVLTLLSGAILAGRLHTARRIHPSEWLILCVGLIAFAFTLLPLFDEDPANRFSATAIAGVPVASAISLLLISAGLLLEEQGSGIVHIASSATPGGMMLRRLIPTVILIGLALGVGASVLIEIVGREDAAFVRAGATLLGIIAMLPLFVFTAQHLNRAHEALERSEVRYRELIQLASDGIFVADLQGRFTEVNDAGCRLLGFSREEILSKTIMDFILPGEKERLFRDRERFLKGGSDISEWSLLRKDGTYLPVEVSAKILPDGRWIAIDRDISERKRAENALRISEATAKQASQARDDMLGVVAHDLRNPLAAIATLAAVLRTNGLEREIGDEIAQAADRMNRMIRDLIDVTLLNAGRFTIKQKRLRASDVLARVLASQDLLASLASVTLRIDAVQGDAEIWADHDRLLQVFENLVGNAIKFTEPGGDIVLGAEARAGEVLFSIADTGCGITSDQLPYVFDRFWQASEGKRGGAGLGLPIVRGIVEAHGGRVWVQSTPDQGSTFFFTIPTAQAGGHSSDKANDVGVARQRLLGRRPDAMSSHETGSPAEAMKNEKSQADDVTQPSVFGTA